MRASWRYPYRDALAFCKTCVQCQMQGSISRRHELSLSQILGVELFDVWGTDFMGHFPSYFGNKYILVVVDFVSKWVEVVDFPNNERRSATKSLKKYIFTRFGTPRAIISDGGSHLCMKAKGQGRDE
ncbi:hypothetical protein MTR67_022877 [Solanum verrucosum]|uniref:Integrase catalytic domain-containing protein n=1 Tax=Solanum verrucosum TaxID=315347 RepID=A0AAF0QVP1_SOLVR|nr:hypothetical protein MTR67_022877 [Solanum verrucosum]